MEEHRPTWDEYFLGIAEAVSKRAACTRRQVGALVVAEHRIISAGYNGAPPGQPHCTDGACPRGRLTKEQLPSGGSYTEGPGICIAIHAEENAINYAGRLARGSTLYCTHDPCPGCDQLAIERQIARVVTPATLQLTTWLP